MSNPLSYPTSKQPFSLSVFQDPPKEYRGAPFWAWVTKQDKTKTIDQVDMFDEMGMGGFHMHTRVGLDIPYMGDEFMSIVEGCVAKAKEKGMHAFLYDEDRWPSGFAGGKVLEGHPELRGLHLLFTPWKYGEDLGYTKPVFPIANAAPVRSELGELLATFAIKLNDGLLVSSRRLNDGEDLLPGEAKWYAYAEPLPDSGFFGDQTYPDLLSSDMTKRFIELTHEVYKKHCGDEFGKTVPSIFTDEPQICPMSTLNTSENKQDIFLPWTLGLVDSYKTQYGEDLVDLLPWIIWDSQEVNVPRYRFLDLICETFASNYMGVIAAWCKKNNLMCTGHMNAEPKLSTQTGQNGEVMRCYRDMDFPGIDMLCDGREYNTAKQAQSVSRQYGRGGLMSEMYGVTGWQFTFEGHKGQGDWQAALGVTLRVHHLFWSTMEGEAKRDYPGCIGYQSPWWKEYKSVEDHFARVNSALTRGRPVTRVAVIHPVESFWLAYGPKDKNFEELEYREQAFEDLTKWLLLGHQDFDFISESLFPDQTPLDKIGKTLPVGECEYDVVIVPNLRTIRSTTLERLKLFKGTIIFAGSTPTLVDAQPGSASVPDAVILPWSKARILTALQPYRDLDMTISESTLYRTQGYRADSLIYQMRAEGDERFVFICNTDRKEPSPVNVVIKGEYKVKALDTATGKSFELKAEQAQGKTKFNWYFDGCESLLLHLSPGASSSSARPQVVLRKDFKQIQDITLNSVSLSEPNSLLLDYCRYQWNDEPWNEAEEVLRIDQIMRGRLGFYKKGAKFRQPYTIPESKRQAAGTLRLRFEFESAIAVSNALLAVETPDKVKLTLDGQSITRSHGWWVDKDIKTLELPSITPGKHVVQIEFQYTELTNPERLYILGDFGVQVKGRSTTIVPLDLRSLEWGDITQQNLPFYSGNITYHCTLVSPGDTELALRAAHYAGPVVSVDVDGSRLGLLITQPRAIQLGQLSKGEHEVDLTCFGNRHNAFGAVHLVPNVTDWLNADSWRSDFDWWSEEYVLGQVGILNAPRVEVPGKEVFLQVRRGYH